MQDSETAEWDEQWASDYVFEKEYQNSHTKKERSLDLKSVVHECRPGRGKMAIKLADIFGDDTMAIVEVNI